MTIVTSGSSFSPVSMSIHLRNFPAKSVTPIIENINQKIKQTSKTFPIEGIAPTRALTTTFIPSKRESARSGLSARSVLSDLMDAICPLPSNSAVNDTIDT